MINGGKRVESLYILSLVAMGTAQARELRSTRLVEKWKGACGANYEN